MAPQRNTQRAQESARIEGTAQHASERAIVVWLPDWPITAYLRTQAREVPEADRVSPDAPLAIVHDGRVVVCSAAARAEGVSRGQKRRDAQAASSRLILLPADESRDERAFHGILTALEELVPGVQQLRPGLAAIRARGPARFYRGEARAAAALLDALDEMGLPHARIGIADGLFTAEQAARTAGTAGTAVPEHPSTTTRAAHADATARTAAGATAPATPARPTDTTHTSHAAPQGDATHPAHTADAPRSATPTPSSDTTRTAFAASQDDAAHAAHATHTAPHSARIAVVPRGESARFLAPLPTTSLGDRDLALLLARLGVQTLGAFAALPVERVRERLGPHGLRLHALAAGADSRAVVPRTPPPELIRSLDLEPPLELAEQVAFAVRQTADAFCDGLGAQSLVCTAVRITLETDRDERSERVWQHPTSFDAASIVDRVRWQLQPSPGDSPFTGGVARIVLEPEAVDDGDRHRPALIGQGPDERAHHAMTRVQAALGHRAVLTPVLGGGRTPAERETLRPWGDASPPPRPRDRPWPGSLPRPLPTEIFRDLRPASVLSADGSPVSVDDRGFVSADPARLDGRAIVAWAGPWPLIERTWDPARSRTAHRFQFVDDAGSAWLAVLEAGAWRLEGKYS